ncbi:hypothetical protein J4E86_006087 [Alternaria arbusti]|uniref:uncharacterized protein n=1 Tax=Alternaria arbusti TaxID=232088 RepID=UPI00221F9AD7|nr:uncharacterized protein J4E86_006087 [Alternaria arbusti]KAI4954777.1 hypothetical protein J4E86_006087 [Alternaria arbusti]
MPPTVTTSTSSGTPTAIPIIATPTPSDGFNGEEFINNLGSDLAPLLTLFGEQVTKQFLSMSLGWADHILLAVGPLGIITTVVSAIRVSNVRVLKAVIGRAREKIATAELELLSSTSYATSELWTDEGVVRQAGHAKILEIIVYELKSTQKVSSQEEIELKAPSQVRIGNLGEANRAGVLKLVDEGRSKTFTDVFGRLNFRSRKQSQVLTPSGDSELQAEIQARHIAWKLARQPPNLALNVHKALPTSSELCTFAIVGAALQLVAVAIPTAMTYYWRKPKGMNSVQDYACPTFLIGTCLLVLGIALCSYIIEATTVEQSFIPTNGCDVKNIFWLQLRQNMGDQPFNAYVIMSHAGDKKIRTSRYDAEETDPVLPQIRRQNQERRLIIAVTLCFTGFICQFVGLRALHWSATVIQLSITLLMTCIRAWIRRGISNRPIHFQLDPDFNFIALSVGDACNNSWPAEGGLWPQTHDVIFHPWNSPDGANSTPSAGLIDIDDPRIVLREMLQSLSTEFGGGLDLLSESLRRAIREVYHNVDSQLRHSKIVWEHVVESMSPNDNEPHCQRLKLETHGQSLDKQVLRALLALWRYSAPVHTTDICVARVFSEKDWKEKVEFLESHMRVKISGLFLSVKGGVAPQSEGIAHRRYSVEDIRAYHRYKCTGLSLENMQDLGTSHGAGQNRSCGYLAIPVGRPEAHFAFELLSGFLDALWQTMKLKYNAEAEKWSVESDGHDKEVDVDEIARLILRTGLVNYRKDAQILVYSSLARCTVWKDPPETDESTSTAHQHPDPPRSAGFTTQDESPRRSQSRPSTAGTAQADENLQDDAATPSNPEHRTTSSPVIPISNVFEPTQAEESSKASSVTSRVSAHQPVPTPSTPSPRVSENMLSLGDKGKHAAT